MEAPIFNRKVIDKIVHRAFDGEQVQVLSYQLQRYSKDRVGHLGSHQNLEVTINRHGKSESENHRFFVKRIPPSTEVHSQFIREKNLFVREAIYLNDILPLLKKSCPDTEDWSPKCLLANDEFVVLEDMRLRNYAMSDTKMLSEDQLKAAFKAQARLHAASLVADKQLGKLLSEEGPNGCTEETFNHHLLYYKCLDLYVDLAEKVAERLGRDHHQCFRTGFRKGIDQVYHRSQLSTRLPRVLLHGDAWSNNYLFDTSDPPKCVVVDYQWMRLGPPMCDTAQLAYLSTTRQLRDIVMHEAIEGYHAEFREVLETNDPQIKRMPSLPNFLEEYEELRATAFLYAVMYYPLIWLSKSTFDKYDEEELYKKLMFRQDNSFVMQVYDEDSLFAARMNEVIQEAVEYFNRQRIPATLD